MSNPVEDLKRELLAAAERQQRLTPVPVDGRRVGRHVGARRLLPIAAAVAFAATAALFFAAPWSSSAPPNWTPALMEKALGKFSVKLVGVVTTKDHFLPALSSHADEEVTSADCRGLGAPTRLGFALFRCQLAYADWPDSSRGAYLGSYWTRPWNNNTVCVSNISRGACPPPLPSHPLRGDPRECLEYWPVSCITEAARVAATKLQGVTYKRCVAGAVWTTYTCTRAGGSATVQFIRRPHSWKTRVTGR